MATYVARKRSKIFGVPRTPGDIVDMSGVSSRTIERLVREGEIAVHTGSDTTGGVHLEIENGQIVAVTQEL